MRRLLGITLSTLLIFLPLSEATAATPKAGSKCKKAGVVAVSKGREFTCIKKKKKLVWSKGVRVEVAPVPTPIPTPVVTPTPVITPTPTPTPTPVVTPTPVITPTPTPTPTQSVTPTPSPSATVREFTAAEVAQRNTQTACWTIVNGNVYDLTQWINAHPGGPGVIRQLCGVDGTTSFSGQHGNQTAPMRELNRFLLGKLKS